MQINSDMILKDNNVKKLIEIALEEDLHGGDSTSESTLRDNLEIKAVMIAKEKGIIAGLILVPLIIEIAKQKGFIKEDLKFEPLIGEGVFINTFEDIGYFEGHVKEILALERTILNFVSRISGIASRVNTMVEILKNSRANIYDTRKTLPGWRLLDKYAVARGGGTNHRLDLSEYLMIKDNHWDGDKQGVLEYLRSLKKNREKLVEIEVDNVKYFDY
ncbi:nicotinate-nucleotide diphosphorylase, partial [bacterium]